MADDQALALCLLDWIPNLGFLAGGFFLVRITSLKARRSATVLMICGVGLVFLGGALQVTWKLLHTVLLLGDPRFLSDVQFVLLAPGFLMMLVSATQVLRAERPRHIPVAAAMALWKVPFLAVMTVCSLSLHGVLSYLSFHRRVRLAGGMFVLAALALLAMAGLAGGEQTIARQWIEESINSVGQLAFAAGSYLLFRHYHRDQVTSEQGLPQAGPAQSSR